MKYLGIDFGLNNIGLSVSEGPLAEPLTQFHYTDKEQLYRFLSTIIADHQPQALVVGISENQMGEQSQVFAENLAKQFSLPVHTQDETLSTQEAKSKLIAAGAPNHKRRLNHQMAATVILQNFLDELPQT